MYTVREFNLLYSIAQSFGGEDYTVEQDIEIDQPLRESLPVEAAKTAIAPAPKSMRQQPIEQPAFYLGPVFS
ncbi:MAG: hypothetical protein U1F40_14455 [Turneriella sp.]